MTTRGNDFLIPYIDSLISSWTAETKKKLWIIDRISFLRIHLPKKNPRKQKELPRNYQLRMKHAIARLDCFNLRTRENNFTQSSRLSSITFTQTLREFFFGKTKQKNNKKPSTQKLLRCCRPLGALNYAIAATADWVVLRYVCVFVYPFSFFRVEFSFLNNLKKKKKVKNKLVGRRPLSGRL